MTQRPTPPVPPLVSASTSKLGTPQNQFLPQNCRQDSHLITATPASNYPLPTAEQSPQKPLALSSQGQKVRHHSTRTTSSTARKQPRHSVYDSPQLFSGRRKHVNPDDDDLLLNMAMMDGNCRRHDSTPREPPTPGQPMTYVILQGGSGARAGLPPPSSSSLAHPHGHKKTRQRRLSAGNDASGPTPPVNYSPSRPKQSPSPQYSPSPSSQRRMPPPPLPAAAPLHQHHGAPKHPFPMYPTQNYHPIHQSTPYAVYPQGNHSSTTASYNHPVGQTTVAYPPPFAPMESERKSKQHTSRHHHQRRRHDDDDGGGGGGPSSNKNTPSAQSNACHYSPQKSQSGGTGVPMGGHRTPAPAPPPSQSPPSTTPSAPQKGVPPETSHPAKGMTTVTTTTIITTKSLAPTGGGSNSNTPSLGKKRRKKKKTQNSPPRQTTTNTTPNTTRGVLENSPRRGPRVGAVTSESATGETKTPYATSTQASRVVTHPHPTSPERATSSSPPRKQGGMTLVPERHTLPDKANKLNLSARSGGKTEEEKRGDDPLSLLLLASTTPPPHKSEEMAGGGGAAGDPPTSTSSSRARAAVVITSSQFQRRIAESILQHDEPQLERLFQLYSTLHSSSITTSTNPRRRAPSPIVLQGKRVVLVDDMTQQPAIPIRFKGTSLIRASEQFQPSLMDYVCDTETGFTLMHLAVLSGEKEMVRRCLYSDLPSSIGGFCCPHRVEDGRGETALTLAMRQAPSCVRMLFDYSVEADRRMDAFAARIREKEMRTPHSTAMAVLSAEESMPCGATSSVVGPTTTPSSLLAPITNVWQRHVLGHRSTNLPDEKRPGGKTREANIPGRHRQLQPLGSMPSASALSPPRSPSPLNPNRRENITTTPAAPAAAVRGLSSGAETTASESGSNGLDQRSGGIYRTTHLMRHTLLHCAVSADAFSPPWPERLAFIQMLVRDYGMRASQENAFGCTPAMWAKENAAYLGGGVKGTAEGRAEVRRIIRFLKTAAEKEEALERSDPKRWLLRQAGVRISPSRSPCRAGGFGDAEEEEEEEAGEDYGKNYNNNHHYNPGLSPHIGRPFRYGEAEKEKGETNNDRVEGGAVGRRVFEPDEDEPEPQCPAHAFATTTTTPPPPAASCAKKRVGFCSPPPVAPLDEKRSSCCTSPSSSSSQTAGGERREQQKGQHHPSHKTRKQAPPNSTAPLHYNSAAAAAPADLYHRGSTCVGVFSASPSPRGPSLRSCGTCPPSPVQTSRKSEERGGGGHSKYAAALATATRIQSRRQGSYIDPDGHSRPREVSPSLRMALSYLEHGSEVREPSMLPHEEMNELLEHQNGNQSRAGATTHQNRKRNKNNGTWNRKEEEDPLVQKSPTTAVKVVALPLLRMSLVTTPAQKIRWYLQGPTARLVMFAVLFLLHLVHNAMDISGSVQHVWRAELWGTVWNMLFSSWLLMTFFMGLIRVGLLIVFGIVLGYHVFPWLVGHWIGVRWLRLPLLGAQSIEEKNFERVAFGLFFSTFYDASQRYKILLRPIGVVGGVYIAAKVYNLCICLGYPEHYRVWATIPDTFYSGSLNTSSPWFYQSAWLTFWGLTFLLDVFAFVFAMDLMHQQGALNVYLPDYRYDQFANWIDGTVYPWLQTWPRCAPGLLLFPARLHITHPWKRWSSLAREVWHAISRRRHTETVASSGSSAQEKNRKRRDAFTSDGGVPSDHFHLRRSVSMMSFRVWWFWAVTTVLLCLLCFPLFLAAGLVRHRYTYGQIQPVSPAMLTLSTGTVVQGWCCVAVASTAVLCLVVVSLQEWHWPSHTVNASLSYPGGLLPRTYAHPSLLFLVLLMGIGTLDLRAVVQNSRVLVLYAPHRGGAIVALILALLPALLGVLILLTATFSTSLRVLQRVLQREAAASQVECDATQTDGSSGGCCARLTRRWRTFRTRSYEVWKLWAMGKHLFALPVPAVFGVLRSLAPELPSWTLLEEQEETTVWWSSQHPTPPLRDGDDCTGVHQAASERAQSFWVAAAALATHQAPVSGGPSCNPHSLRSSGTAGGAAYLAPLFDPMADLTARQDAVYRLAVTELVDVLEAQQLLQRIAAHWVLTEQQQDDNDNDEDEDEDETEESRLERLEDVEEGEMLTAIANATTPQSSRIRPAVARAEEEEEEETSATTTSLSLSTAVCRRVMFTLRRRQRLAFWKKQQSRLRLLTYLGHAVPSSNVAPSAYPASRVAPAGRSSAAPDGLIMVDPKERHKQQLLYESKREAYKQQMWNNRARQRQYQHQRRSPSTKRRSPSARRVAAR